MKQYRKFLSIILVTSIVACTEDKVEQPTEYRSLEVDENTELGRVLFYDTQLSLDNTISCASCHKQELAFADNVAFSRGVKNNVTARNSMALQNLGTSEFDPFTGQLIFTAPVSTPLFWDGRETNMTEMMMKPIVNHLEMGISDLDFLCEKLEKTPYYEELFQKKYGTKEITPERIADALSGFVSRIQSVNTKLDFGQLNSEESRGFQLFFEKYQCNECHQVQIPRGYLGNPTSQIEIAFSNIGLDDNPQDLGVGHVSGKLEDAGKFKIPNLRNVALTGPYMHDGRFETLEEVIEHYSTGIRNNDNLDDRLKDNQGKALVLNITQSETEAMVAFLESLTDNVMITDPSLSDPFKTVQR